MDILPKIDLDDEIDENEINDIEQIDNLEIVTPDYKKPNKSEKEIFILPADVEDISLKNKIKKIGCTKEQKELIKKEKELLKQKRLEEKLEQQALKDADKEFKRIQREKKKQEKLQRQKLRDEEFIRNKSEPIKIPVKKPEALKEKKPDDSFEDFLANYQKYEKFKNMILQNEKQNKKTKSVTESERTETTFSETSSDDIKPVFRYDYLNQNSFRKRRF